MCSSFFSFPSTVAGIVPAGARATDGGDIGHASWPTLGTPRRLPFGTDKRWKAHRPRSCRRAQGFYDPPQSGGCSALQNEGATREPPRRPQLPDVSRPTADVTTAAPSGTTLPPPCFMPNSGRDPRHQQIQRDDWWHPIVLQSSAMAIHDFLPSVLEPFQDTGSAPTSDTTHYHFLNANSPLAPTPLRPVSPGAERRERRPHMPRPPMAVIGGGVK